MFECNYKFLLTDAIKCAKYVYKFQKRLREKIIVIVIPILILVTVGMLVLDSVNHKSIVWDIVLIVSMVILETLTLSLPYFVVRSQIRQYKSQDFDNMDSLSIKILNGMCEEAMIKNGEKILQNKHNLKSLVSYIEDDEGIILVYAGGEYTYIKKAYSNGDLNKLKSTLTKAMTIKTKK